MFLIDHIVALDHHVATALNTWAGQPTVLNRLVVRLSEANWLKVTPFVLVAAWYWNCEPRMANRKDVANGFVGIALALVLNRALQLALPFRPRPIHDALLGLDLPAGLTPEILGGWSSFPSDHAAIFAALVGLLVPLSRRLARLGLAYAILFVLLPRLYLGVHNLSDLVAGFAIGALAAWIAHARPLANHVGPAVERLARLHPAPFYTVGLLMLTQVVQMFGDVRQYGSIAKGLLAGTL
ncbi:MAG: phosphatase PAP2 family protein [Proteobacteria bacterium]|nr:phosphatase PAP2 family protein [Pseudomonadota bacterium]